MTEVLDININTQENINVYLPEEVSCGTIEAYFGESAELTLDVSLKYIKSGQQAIQDYVNTQINPTFYKYIDEAKEAAKNADADADNAAESATIAYNSEQNAIAQANKATEEANAAAESAYQAQTSALAAHEYASNAEADAQNALETLGHVLESETISTNAANTATQKAQEASESAADAQESAEEAQRIKDSLGNIYVFKGSVNTIADLPENANIGDVYDVLDSGTNYAWTGDRWDSLGASFDLSEYAKKTDIKNGTLTIQKNGVNIATFTANQSGNTTANIVADTQVNADWNATGGVAQILNKPTIPTTTSQLTNNSDFTTKAYVDTTEQEIIQNFMDADTALQTQITGLSGVLDGEQDKIMAIEGKIPTNASTSNLLSTASDLLNATQDVRSDFAEADSELQTQINGQATAISDLSDDVTANMGEIADIKEQIKNFDALPSQTGNAGKYLTTNGTTANWGDVVSSTITYWGD